MKKILTFFFVISLYICSAQNKDGNIGLKGGFNFSTITGDIEGDVSRRMSFNIGLMLETKLSNRFALQPEVVFSSQGFKVRYGEENLVNRLNYVNIPILFKMFVSDVFSFDIGPQLGVLISAKQSSTSTNDNDIKTVFNERDYALILGVSYKIMSRLNISARYNFGLKDIKNERLSSFGDSKIKNGVFQLAIGYYFKNKNK